MLTAIGLSELPGINALPTVVSNFDYVIFHLDKGTLL